MEEGRVYTHGTLSAVQRRSDRAGAAELRGCQVRTTLRRFWNVAFGRLWNVRRAPARRSLRVMVARALLGPLPGLPCGPNVRCKKTNRATQRTNQC